MENSSINSANAFAMGGKNKGKNDNNEGGDGLFAERRIYKARK